MKNKIGQLIVALVLAVTFVGGGVAQAIQCKAWNCSSQCIAYRPTPLPGFTGASVNTTTSPGSVIMGDASGDYAIDILGAGGFYNLASLGDWSYCSNGTGNTHYIYSWKSQLAGNITFYSSANFTGFTCTLPPGTYNISYLPGYCGFYPNSIKMQN